MKLSVPYNGANIDLSLPDDRRVDVFDPPFNSVARLNSERLFPEHSRNEIRDFVLSSDALVVINDEFRPTPTAKILEGLFSTEDLHRLRLLVATGVHPPPDEVSLRKLVGSDAQDAATIQLHSAFADEELVELGSGENRVRLNRHLVNADALLIIGSIEPHYFAGFTGGRKIILPGCASFADVERNHSLAVSESSQPLRTVGNPVWEDIQNRTSVLDTKKRLAIQLACDHSGNIYYVSHGNWDESYLDCCEFVEGNFPRCERSSYDVAVCVVYPPLDRNFYQLQKSYENVATAVRDGGTVLLISACSDGIGDRHFIDLARAMIGGKSTSRNANSESGLMGIHKVERTRKLAERVQLSLFSRLQQHEVEPLPIELTSNLDQTIQELMENYGPSCRVAVVLDSASQVLYSG